MKEGFKSINEILLEVAEEEGMDFAEIKDVWKHQKKYVKQQMDSEKVYAIFLPFIGTLSLNVKQYTREIRGKTRSLYEKLISKIKKLKNHENYTGYGNAHKKVTGVIRLTEHIISNYKTGLESKKNMLIHSKCWDVLSKHSNGAFNKIKNNE